MNSEEAIKHLEELSKTMIKIKYPGEVATYTTRGESNESVDKKIRYTQIIEILSENKEPMSAKEIAAEMLKKGYIPTSERNFTSPRLTELSQKGIVEPFGKKKCQYTGKTVAVYVLRDKWWLYYEQL